MPALLTVAPSLASLDQFIRLLPAGTLACVTETGVASAALGGVTSVIRPGIVVRHANDPGAALLAQAAARPCTRRFWSPTRC